MIGPKKLRALVLLVVAAAIALTLSLMPVARASTISVTTTADALADDGNCSLREAIRAANLDAAVDACPAGSGADVIELPAGTYTLALAGRDEDAAASGDLDITGDLAITGALSSTTIIDGGGIDRVFDARAGAKLTISNATIQHGDPGIGSDGGGARNDGALELISTRVISNTADEFAGGGIRSGGALTVTGSLIAGNTAGHGGGIESEGTLLLRDSVVADNQGGGVASAGQASVRRALISGNTARGSGGGIASFSGSLLVADSTIISNTAELGGGIRSSGTLSVTNSLIRGNGGELGGGIASDAGSAAISSTTISANTGSGVANSSVVDIRDSAIEANTGSGIFNDTRGSATVAGTLIDGNADSGANNRGALILSASAVIGNTAPADGGGLNSSGTLTVTNTTVSGNSATGNGGGIASSGPRASLNNVTVANNLANSGEMGLGDGGGIYAAGEGQFALANTLVASNTVALAGSAQVAHPDCLGAFVSLGYNLVGDSAGAECAGFADGTNGDKVGGGAGDPLDPKLGALGNNGGRTPTHALAAGSPAADAGSPAAPGDPGACEPVDQRGVPRPQGPRCDIGAFELVPPDPGGGPNQLSVYQPVVFRNWGQ